MPQSKPRNPRARTWGWVITTPRIRSAGNSCNMSATTIVLECGADAEDPPSLKLWKHSFNGMSGDTRTNYWKSSNTKNYTETRVQLVTTLTSSSPLPPSHHMTRLDHATEEYEYASRILYRPRGRLLVIWGHFSQRHACEQYTLHGSPSFLEVQYQHHLKILRIPNTLSARIGRHQRIEQT